MTKVDDFSDIDNFLNKKEKKSDNLNGVFPSNENDLTNIIDNEEKTLNERPNEGLIDNKVINNVIDTNNIYNEKYNKEDALDVLSILEEEINKDINQIGQEENKFKDNEIKSNFSITNVSISIIVLFATFTVGVKHGEYSSAKYELVNYLESVKERELDKIPHLENKKIEDVLSYINDNYYDADSLEKEKLENAIIDGIVSSLGDKHSEFFDKKENLDFQNIMNGDFEGIGAVVQDNEKGSLIEKVIKNSPAMQVGLQKGDIIIKVDNIDVAGKKVSEVIPLIKGTGGTIVNVSYLRDGKEFNLDITRGKVIVPTLELTYDKDIAILSIGIFGEHTYQEFVDSLIEINSKDNIKGLIIDVRDNGGGYLDSYIEIMSHFVPENSELVSIKYKDNTKDFTLFSKKKDITFDKPIVILVNNFSASASEILAGALQYYKKAVVVGTKTFGKGSVQEPFALQDGSMIKITVAKWYLPNGKTIDGTGIEPDKLIDISMEEFLKGKDNQKEEAKKIINSNK